jgi:hypothetical protein
MSFLRWKQETSRRKSLFVITNPVTILQCVVVLIILFFVLFSSLKG